MLMLVASLAVFMVGPLIYSLAGKIPARGVKTALEILVVVAVAGITLFEILPEIIEVTGWLAMAPLALGLLGPTIVERFLRTLANPAHAAVRVLVVLGLATHELLDGVALAISRIPGAVVRGGDGAARWGRQNHAGLRGLVPYLRVRGSARGPGATLVPGTGPTLERRAVIRAGSKRSHRPWFQCSVFGMNIARGSLFLI